MNCIRCGALVLGVGVVFLSASAQARVVSVSTASQLVSAVLNALPGDEIVIAPGTYTVNVYLSIRASNVTVRGVTGNCDDVIVQGLGMNASSAAAREGFNLYANDIMIQDLTVQEFYYHAIHFQTNIYRPRIRNVVTRNNGDQHIKGAKFNYDGIIENCLMENTYPRTNDGIRPNDYLGGIDLHGAVNFVIRDNIVRNIIGAGGDGDAGIFIWNESANCTVERNTIYGCNKGIAYGNPSSKGVYHVAGGIIRNNFIVNAVPGDLGMELCFVRDIKCYNNTIYNSSASNLFRSLQLYDDIVSYPTLPNQNVQLACNIIRGSIKDWTSGRYTSTGNLLGTGVVADWFVDAAHANLHLTRLATAAIGQAVLLVDVPTDYDGQTRPIDGSVDIGADEYVSSDTNGDGHVDVVDLLYLVDAFGSVTGDANYDPRCDFNSDGAVDVVDLLILVENFGT